ncbi:MAG: EFR1 family ferrodoxin [Anaerolineaceae bacterium]|nr:EFR1 family ferrodoxin [Anaerolineaceae bacterium]
MDFLLIYYSGTGNTKLISQEIEKRLTLSGHTVELVSIEEISRLKSVTFRNKTIGFGFPVYKFTYPDIFKYLFAVFNEKGNNNPYFLYCTYARFTAETFYDFSKNLDNEKFRLIEQCSFKSPSNGISSRMPENAYEYETVMFFEDDIAGKIDTFTNHLLDNLKKESHFRINQKYDFVSPLRLKIVKDIERTKYPKLQIDSDRCTVCGVCAAHCPDDNLVKTADDIKIVDQEGCLHCLRCMHHCPQNAISYGKLSKGENRYTYKTRNKLFEKASSGYKEIYWADFHRIRSKWRRNTITYWLTHRRKPEIE